ncbi:hypothetical protein ACWEKT_11010 [Nocardia takedensis]|uniref:hypothetical protein n=1 Tax=Nocardia takedensis TaxID=259390 RepID=UPI0012F6A146|nr:hypothetical protein [Nocardia takedensis]
MSPHRSRRTARALVGAVLVGLTALAAPAALAAPPAAVPIVGDGPFAGPDTTHAPPGAPRDERAEKAEDLGGTLANEVIDLVTGVLTCGLNIATDSVKCTL